MKKVVGWTAGLFGALVLAVLLVLAFPPTGWIAGKIEEIVAERTGYALRIGDLDLDLLSATPSATVSSVAVDGGQLPGLLEGARAEAAIDLGAALGGEIVVDRVALSDATIRLERDADGETSWTPGSVDSLDAAEPEPAPIDDEPLTLPTIRELAVEDVDILWSDAVTDTSARLAVAARGSTLPDARPLTVSVDGTANEAPVRAELTLGSPLEDALAGGPVRVALDASTDGATLALGGTVGAPATLGDIDLQLDADIDSLDAIETALGTELPPLAPSTLAATLRTEGGGLVLVAGGDVAGEPVRASVALNPDAPLPDALSGTVPVALNARASVGEARVALTGRVGAPAALEDIDLRLDADVDSLAALEGLLDARLPELAPAALAATVRSDGDGLVVRADGAVDGEPVTAVLDLDSPVADALAGGPVQLDLAAEVGGAQVALAGRVGDLRTLGDADLGLDVNVESLEAVERLTGAELPDLDSASLSGTVRSDDDGLELRADGSVDDEPVQASLQLDSSIDDVLAGEPVRLDVDASVGGATVSASGGVEDLRTFKNADLDLEADVQSLAALESILGTELPELAPADLDATVRTEDGRTVLDADGTVDGEPVRATLELESSLDGLLAGDPLQLDLDASVGGATVSASGSVEDPAALTGVDLQLDADVESLAAVEKLTGADLPDLDSASLSATVRSDDDGVDVQAEGSIDGEPVDASVRLDTSIDDALAGEPVRLDASASVGGASVSASGGVDDLRTFKGADLDVDADMQSLDAVETLLGTDLPDIAPASFDGALSTDGDFYVLEGLDLSAAGSTLTGDARVNPTTGPPTVYANLVSPKLDVDALLDALGGDVEEAVDEAAEETGAPTEPSGTVLPVVPLPVELLFGEAQGAVELSVDEVAWSTLPVESLDARVEIDPSRVSVDVTDLGLAGGDIGATLVLTPAGEAVDEARAIDAKLDARISRVGVGRLLPDLEVVEDAGGPLGGEVELWASGDSVASLAGSLDGGVLLLMGRGELDALLVELAGLDLFQSVGDLLQPGEKEFSLRCAYASLSARDGVVSVDDFVIDSADTVFLAKGEVDLGAETLDLVLEPHPKDPSLLAASSAVTLGGTFADLDIGVTEELPLRAAAAAALAVVATPAAALLPFIETGGGEDSGFCELEGALDGDAG